MRILIKIKRSPEKRFLVHVPKACTKKEIRKYLKSGKLPKAMVTALSKGKVLREVEEREIPHIDTDLILTEHNAHYDLM